MNPRNGAVSNLLRLTSLWLSGLVLALASGQVRADILAQEPFAYPATAWDYAIPGNYNAGTGWASAWQINLNPPGGHNNGHAAILGATGYEPYAPEEAYTAGHGGFLFRDLSAPLSTAVGTKYFFAADIFTPTVANTAAYLNLGGFSLGIEAQAGKPGELILFAPNGDSNWNDPKPPGFTNLYGSWHRLQGEVDFVTGGSVLSAWVDASQASDPSLVLNSTSSSFNTSQLLFAHWGDSGYGLMTNLTLGTSFQNIAVPEPGTISLLALGAGWLVSRRRLGP